VDEYVEVRTDVAERELKRIKHEQSTATQRLTVGHNHGHYIVCVRSTHGSDDSLAGYQATVATTEEPTADCCDRQPVVVIVAA